MLYLYYELLANKHECFVSVNECVCHSQSRAFTDMLGSGMTDLFQFIVFQAECNTSLSKVDFFFHTRLQCIP